MDELLDQVVLDGFAHIGWVYGRLWVAPLLVFPAMAIWAAHLGWRAYERTHPYVLAARARVQTLKNVLGDAGNPVEERERFASEFLTISEAMEANEPGAEPLRRAWHEFHESIVDERQSPIKNTARPSSFFGRGAPRQDMLILWSNLFVGIGLVLTFLGIVIALSNASEVMSSEDLAASSRALQELIRTASAKFVTSIAGLLASLALRGVEHRLSKNVREETERICALLERGLLYVPPQRLAAQQLEQLEAQTAELRSFNTDLAFQIGERVGEHLQAAITPVAAGLTTLNASMGESMDRLSAGVDASLTRVNDSVLSMGDHLREGLGQSAADAISAAASGELRALGQTLEVLRSELAGMGGAVSASGEEAARTLNEAAKAMSEAGAQAAETMQRELTAALAQGLQMSQETFRQALEQSGEGLRTTGVALAAAVGAAAERVEQAGGAFEASARQADAAAASLRGATDSGQSLSASLADAARGLAEASAPVTEATGAMRAAAEQVAQASEAGRAAQTRALAELAALAEGVRQVQGAAEAAWRDYRARFEGVDKSLEGAAVQMAATLGDSLGEFRRFAHAFDAELSKSIGKLSGTLATVEDHAEGLDETTAALRSYAASLDGYARTREPIREAAE